MISDAWPRFVLITMFAPPLIVPALATVIVTLFEPASPLPSTTRTRRPIGAAADRTTETAPGVVRLVMMSWSLATALYGVNSTVCWWSGIGSSPEDGSFWTDHVILLAVASATSCDSMVASAASAIAWLVRLPLAGTRYEVPG